MNPLSRLVSRWSGFAACVTFSPSGSALFAVCSSQAWALRVARSARSVGLPVVVVARCACSSSVAGWVVACGFSLSGVLAHCRTAPGCSSLFRVWSPSFSGVVGLSVGSWCGLGFWSPGVRYSVTRGFSMRSGWRPFRSGSRSLLWSSWIASGCFSGAPSLRQPLAGLRGVCSATAPARSFRVSGVRSFVGGSVSTLARLLASLPVSSRPFSVLWRPSRRVRAAVASCLFPSFSAAALLAQRFPGATLRRAGSGWSVSVPFRGWPGGRPLARLLSASRSV